MSNTLDKLRREVMEANLEIVRQGLVISTFGNASGIWREKGLVVIKPSGVDYDSLTPDLLVVADLEGNRVEGELNPSSDLATHLVLYRAFLNIGGVVHTHSRFATAWAQAGRQIPCLGTTHADYFHGSVPITEPMSREEIELNYEENTGEIITRRFREISCTSFPAVLVYGHGPFAWGRDARDAAHNALLLEEIARIAYYTETLNSSIEPIPNALRDKHFLRKHGPDAYYGQKREE